MGFVISALFFIVLAIIAVLIGGYLWKRDRAKCMIADTQPTTEDESLWTEVDNEVEEEQEDEIVPEPEDITQEEPEVQEVPAEENAVQAEAEEPVAETPEIPEVKSEESVTEIAVEDATVSDAGSKEPAETEKEAK